MAPHSSTHNVPRQFRKTQNAIQSREIEPSGMEEMDAATLVLPIMSFARALCITNKYGIWYGGT